MAKKKKARTRPKSSSLQGLVADVESEEAAEDEAASKQKRIKRSAKKPTKKRTRKISKQAQVKDLWDNNRDTARDLLMDGIVDACRKEFADGNIMIGGESDMMLGVRFPALCLEWLFDNNVFPLSRYVNIIGPPHTCKSALVYEIGRWFRMYGGTMAYIENETKFAEDFCMSILGYPSGKPYIYMPSKAMEHWQHGLISIIKTLKKKMTGTKEKPGPGRIIPVVMAIDSLAGKLSLESLKKIQEDGHAGRSFPLEALSISRFMASIPQQLEEWPFTLLTTNHLKPKKNDQGMELDHQPGGHAVRFQEAIEIKMMKAKSTHIDRVDLQGRALIMKITKNSHGQSERRLPVRLLWRTVFDDENDGASKQITNWDWGWSNVMFLHNFKAGGEMGKRIRKILPFVVDSIAGDGTVKCAAYKETKTFVPFAVLGARLQEDEERMKKLRNLLGIKRRKIFDPTIDYRDQQYTVQKEAGVI